jgi:hypothetical protein
MNDNSEYSHFFANQRDGEMKENHSKYGHEVGAGFTVTRGGEKLNIPCHFLES